MQENALMIDVHDDGSVTAIVGTKKKKFSEGTEQENFMEAVEWGDKQLYNQENKKGDS